MRKTYTASLLTILIILFHVSAFAQSNRAFSIAKGSNWDYNSTDSDVSIPFRLPFYEDAPAPIYNEDDWQGVKAPVGFGEANLATTISGDNRLVFYFTNDDAAFEVAGGDCDSIFLYLRYDDGIEVHVNGVSVYKGNLGIGLTPHTTAAAGEHEATKWEKIDITTYKSLFIAGDNKVAVSVHQQDKASDDMVFDLGLEYVKAASTQLPVSLVDRGPYLQGGTSNSAIVRWRTTKAGPTKLSYGSTPGLLDQQYEDTRDVTDHIAAIKGLQPDTKYYYSIDAAAGYVNDPINQYFLTFPIEGTRKKTRIWSLGDFGDGSPVELAVYLRYMLENAGKTTDLWVWLGDNAYSNGTEQEYQTKVYTIYKEVMKNHMIYPSAGNHDMGSCNADLQYGPYFNMFSLPTKGETGGHPSNTEAYYSYNYGNIHFVVLESTQSNKAFDGPMAEWLKKDLALNKQEWTIAYWHHPPYSKGSHNSDTESELIRMRENFLPILEAGGVDLVMTGHSHSYERSYLVDGHYGKMATLNKATMFLAGESSGNAADGKSYHKPKGGAYSHKGAVYMVNGSGGSYNPNEDLDHPVNMYSKPAFGSVVLEIEGNTLNSSFINTGGLDLSGDDFTIVKDQTVPCEITGIELGNDRTVCPGEAVSFTLPFGYKSYEWMHNGSSSIGMQTTYTATEAGLYTVKVSRSEDCYIIDNVTIKNPSNPIPMADTVPLCKEVPSQTLNAGSGFFSYAWSNGSNAQSINVNSPGNYTVTVQDFAGCTFSKSARVKLYQPLASIPGPDYICGNEARLIQPFGNWQGFRWSDGSTSSFISVSQQGNYAVTVTDAFGCKATASKFIYSYPLPQIPLVSTVGMCPNEPAVLNAGNFPSVKWSTGATSGSITVLNSGIYNVTVADNKGCTAFAETGVYQLPSLNPGFIIMGNQLITEKQPVVFEDTTKKPHKRLWEFGDGETATISPVTHTYKESGVYLAKLSIDDGECKAQSENMITVLELSGMQDNIELRSLNILPNPSDGSFVLVFSLRKGTDKLGITVADLEGRLVYQERTKAKVQENTIPLRLSAIPKGVYILSLSTGDSSIRAKLFIQ